MLHPSDRGGVLSSTSPFFPNCSLGVVCNSKHLFPQQTCVHRTERRRSRAKRSWGETDHGLIQHPVCQQRALTRRQENKLKPIAWFTTVRHSPSDKQKHCIHSADIWCTPPLCNWRKIPASYKLFFFCHEWFSRSAFSFDLPLNSTRSVFSLSPTHHSSPPVTLKFVLGVK